jgi:uncharacterized protein YndB with AHSA1/START domain
MTRPEFIYTTYIKTTPEKLWAAITNPEFTHQYWGHENISGRATSRHFLTLRKMGDV